MSKRTMAGLAAGALGVAGLGTGLGLSLGSGGTVPASATAAPYGFYRSVMGRFASAAPSGGTGGSYGPMGGGPGPMMGGPAGSASGGVGSYGWMMDRTGYAWMMGGARAPGWMRGEDLPGFVSGGADGPGSVMGRLFANAPGERMSPAEAKRLGSAPPEGATLDRAGNRVVFDTAAVHLVVLASPSMPSESFRVAGMTDPTIVVPKGARVDVELVNADEDMAHGLVVARRGAASSPMPMMTAAPAFSGAALWFLGEATSAGMHAGRLAFTASAAGTYAYLCPVPGHAAAGMAGAFVVSAAS